VTLLFYNPNIHPNEEYNKRLNEAIKFSKIVEMPLVELKEDEKLWFEKVKKHEHEKEGGDRCSICFKHRLDKTAEIAKTKGFDLFTTTLTVSPYKNSKRINLIGKDLQEKFSVDFLESDFKKGDGYNKSIELSKEHDLYRQHYCGCVYSKR
jgi:predicted adenine nucleotide alpha hydrolase (AANH) superfamily ATPase